MYRVYINPVRLLAVTGAMMAFLALMFSASPVSAAEKSAKIKGYCKKHHGREAFPDIDRRDNGLVCSIRKSGGLAITMHKVSAADICAEQHNTRNFYRTGKRLICLTGSDATAKQTINLKKHCREAHGQNAIVTKRLTDGSSMCTVKTDGGLAQTNNVIDVASLCGNRPGRIDGDRLHCGQPGGDVPPGGTQGQAKGKDRPTEQDEGRPAEQDGGKKHGRSKPAPSRETVARVALSEGKLEECGIAFHDKIAQLLKTNRMTMVQGGMDFPCPGLSGGWPRDLDDHCKTFSKAAAGMFTSSLDWQGSKPACRIEVQGRVSMKPVRLDAACSLAYEEMTGEKIHTQPNALAFRWQNRQLNCFLVSRKSVDCYAAFLTKGAYPPECQSADVKVASIIFTRTEPPFDEIEEIPMESAFRVVVTFEGDPGRTTEPVRITNERTGQSIEVIAKQTADPKVFYTGPVTMQPEVTP